jgi:hypothetical protein
MYNQACKNKCNIDKNNELIFTNNYIVCDTDQDEDYITINKIREDPDELFTHIYLNKNTFEISILKQIENNSVLNKNNIVEADNTETNVCLFLKEPSPDKNDYDYQITEYKKELIVIETEINILNNIIFNMIVYNKRNIFNLHKFNSHIYNKKNRDTLMIQIKKITDRKKIIETKMNDIDKLMKIQDKTPDK